MGKKRDISYCIITDGEEPNKLLELIESIRHETGQIPHEIIVAGDLPWGEFAIDDWVPMETAAKEGRLGKMRNAACRRARGDILIVLDDDMILQPGFYNGLTSITADWQVICPNVINPDKTRFWGWATHINGLSKLRQWDEPDTGDNYVTGGVCIMRRQVFERVQWNESFGFYQGEDVEFSARLHRAGIFFTPAPNCFVMHNARYTQKGDGVYRL